MDATQGAAEDNSTASSTVEELYDTKKSDYLSLLEGRKKGVDRLAVRRVYVSYSCGGDG